MHRIGFVSALATAALAFIGLQGSAFADVPTGWSESSAALTHVGSTVLATAGDPAATSAEDTAPGPQAGQFFHGVENGSQAHLPAPAGTPISSAPSGFDGLSYLDQRLADGGNQPVVTAPSQALCVGAGYVIQGVSDALRVYSTTGTPLTGAVALGPFFGDGHAVLGRNPTVLGVQHADPRCLFDEDIGRFVVTASRYHVDSSTGAFTGTSAIDIAVSRTSDPRAGWDVYTVDTTSDGSHGSAQVADCPCLGNQPELGADANGIYVTSMLFAQQSSEIAGERFFAISKRHLAAGSAESAATLTLPRGARPPGPFPVHTDPAVVPPGGTPNTTHGGTEYLTSLCNVGPSVAYVYALTNTSSLDSSSPDLSLSEHVIATEATSYVGAFEQREGSRPLATWIQQQTGGGEPPLEYLLPGTPCSQVVYADGRLWTARMTVVKPANGPVRMGIAWLEILPGPTGGQVAKQGYLSIDRDNALLGAIAVDRTGHGVLSFGVYGADRYPSAAYVPIDENGIGAARIVADGQVPVDNFDGYAYFGAPARFADYGLYGAAVAAGDGDFWIGQEYMPDIPRTRLVSWGTHITEVHR